MMKYAMDVDEMDLVILEEELRTTPSKDWQKDRDTKIKSQKASEKKRWKMRLKSLEGPEIIDNLNQAASKSIKFKLKKFQAILFSQQPIQTGISVETNMMKKVLASPYYTPQFELGLTHQDNQSALSLAHHVITSHQDQQDHHMNLNPNVTGPWPSMETDHPVDKVKVDLNRNTESAPNLMRVEVQQVDVLEVQPDPQCQSLQMKKMEQHLEKNINILPQISDVESFERYKLKYWMKEQAKTIMERNADSKPQSPEMLLKELLDADPGLLGQDNQLLVKYATKFFYKFNKIST